NLKRFFWFMLIGFVLGFLATLLGIGGGPINVALLMYCFGMEIKEATVYSIVTIFFSQLSKLVTIQLTSGFGAFDLAILWAVIPGALIGGFSGATLSGKLSAKKVTLIYQVVIIGVILLNVLNALGIY